MSALDERLYRDYATLHAGQSDPRSAGLAYRRQLRPLLPGPAAGRAVLDIGCGQGDLVGLLAADGFAAHGVDRSREQVALAHARGRHGVRLGDFHDVLTGSEERWDAVVATDVLEHLGREEVLRTFEDVRRALRPGGVFVARVPNAVSPTGGHIMFSDITHRTWFTERSVRQLAAATGFTGVRAAACPPMAHGIPSALRGLVWLPVSGLLKLSLAAETGRLRGHIVTHNLVFAARREPLKRQ